MGDTNISGLGKILSGNEVSVSGDKLKENCVKVEFSEIMAHSGMKSFCSQNLYQNAEVPAHRSAEPSLDEPPVADYEKFQYRDNKIPEKTECRELAESNVVEEKMTEFSNQVKEVLKEELGVSEEEIASAMETLGLSYADLLNQNNLANLVTELTGDSDICGLLCNEQFLNILQSVNALSQELLQELGLDMEELIGFLDAQDMADAGLQAGANSTVEDVDVAQNAVEKSIATEELTVTEEPLVAEKPIITEEPMVAAKPIITEEPMVTEEAVEMNQQTVAEGDTVSEEDVLKILTDNASEENSVVNTASGKQNLEDSENVAMDDAVTVADESVMMTEKTETSGQQGEETTDGMQQQDELVQLAVMEEETDGNTQKPTFRQVVKETNEQAVEGIQVNQNVSLNSVSGTETIQSLPNAMNMREIMNQLVDAVRVTVSADMNKMEMQLNPENLGKMYLEIVEKDGVISAKIQLQNETVKEAVEAQIVELRQNLSQAGVKVDAVEVTVASHEFERNLEQDAKQQEQQAAEQEKSAKQRRINLNNLDELSGLMSEEEALVAKMMAEQGNSIDFTA